MAWDFSRKQKTVDEMAIGLQQRQQAERTAPKRALKPVKKKDKTKWFDPYSRKEPLVSAPVQFEAPAQAFLSAGTLGISDILPKYTQPERMQAIQQEQAKQPLLTTGATIAGYVAPFGGATAIAKPLLAKAFPTVAKTALKTGVGTKTIEAGLAPLAGRVAEGAVAGMGVTGIEGLIKGESPQEILRRTGEAGIIGAVADTAFYGLGKAIPPLKQAFGIGAKEIPEAIPKLKLGRGEGLRQKPLITEPITPIPRLTRGEGLKQRPLDSIVRPLTESLDQTGQITQPLTSQLTQPKIIPTEGTKLRRTIHNSLEQSQLDPEIKQHFREHPQTYEVLKNKDVWDSAVANVKQDLNKAISDIYSKQSLDNAYDTANAVAVLNELSNQKNYLESIRLAEDFARKGTDAGQAVQAIRMLSKTTPEGKLLTLSKAINNFENAMKQTDSSKYNKFVAEAFNIKTDLDSSVEKISSNIEKEILKNNTILKILSEGSVDAKDSLKLNLESATKPLESIDNTAERILANKIKTSLKTGATKQEDDLIKKMISDLFKKYKKTTPKQAIKEKDVLKDIVVPVENRQEYARVWQRSKEILRAELDEDTFSKIDNFVNTGVRPVFDEKKLSQLIKTSAKDKGLIIKDIVKKFSREQFYDRKAIKQEVLKRLNLSNTDAEYVSKFIDNELKNQIKLEKENLLAKYFKDVKPKTYKQDSRLEELINIGVLENQKYINRFSEKLPREIKVMLNQADIKLDDLVRISTADQASVKKDLINTLMSKLRIDDKYYSSVKNAIDDTFKNVSKEKKDKIIEQMLKPRKEYKQKTMVQRITELEGLGALENDLIKEKYGIPFITQKDAEYIIEGTKLANAMPEGRAKDIALAKIDQFITDKIPMEKGDKIRALRNISLLLNPKTLIRNPIGNLIFSIPENIASIPSGATDLFLSKALGTQRLTPIIPNVKAQTKGFSKGFKEVIEDISNKVDTSPTRTYGELPRSRKVFDDSTKIGQAANTLNNILGDALKLGDRPFYEAAFQQRIAELRRLNPDMPMSDMIELAREYGLERTFQNQSAIATSASGIKRNMNMLNVKGFGLGDVVLPYTQTPANILQKGAEYTPLGVIKILKIATKGKEGIKANQKTFTDAVGRLFTGTGAMFLGYNLMKSGNVKVTGKFTGSKKEKELKKATGEQQYSIKIGDKWYSYDWAQPIAIPIAMGVDAYNAGVKEDDFINKYSKGVISGGDTLMKQSMLRGLTNLFGGQSPSESVASTIAQTPSSFVPTALGQVSQLADPYKREVEYDTLTKQMLQSVQKRTPARQGLEPQLDITGKPIKEPGKNIVEKAFLTFVSPANVSKESNNRTVQEINRVYNATGDTDVIPYKMPEDLKDIKDKNKFKKSFGTTVFVELSALMSSQNYIRSSEEEKAKLISRIIEKVYDEEKDKLKKTQNILR